MGKKRPAPSSSAAEQQGSTVNAPPPKHEDEDEESIPPLVDDDEGGASGSATDEPPPLVDGPEEDEEPPPLVDGPEEDEPPPLVDGPEEEEGGPEDDDEPPPLVDGPEEEEEEGKEDEPPPLLESSEAGSGSDHDKSDASTQPDDDDMPPLVDSEHVDSMPSLTSDPAGKGDDDIPSLISDPEAKGEDGEQDEDEPMPDLTSDEESEESDESEDEVPVLGGKDEQKPPGFRPGFLDKSQRGAQPYAKQGVGQRERVDRPAPAAKACKPAATAASAAAARSQQKERAGPQMADMSEISQINQERQKERDALARQQNLTAREAAAANTCIGRCCLRPGSLGFGGKWSCDKQGFSVRESERRLLMSCSNGCLLLFHYPGCWRGFKDGHRAMLGKEVEDVVLKGAKKKMVPFPCLTDSCAGYMRQAVLLEGPRGEVMKHKQYDIPPELEEQLQEERRKEREEKLTRYCKRKPAEDQVPEGPTHALAKEKKKKVRKGEAGMQGAEGADAPQQPQQQPQQQQQQEGWTDIGGLSRGLRKEAAREAREADRARDAAAKAAKEQDRAAGPSGGIKIARRAQPEPEQAAAPEEDEEGRMEEEQPAPVPEFLIPDDTLLKPLHKVAEEEEAEAERQRVAAAAHAHKEQREQQEQRAASERDAQSKQQAAEAQQRKKKKATKLNLGSLWQETGGTYDATSPNEADLGTDSSGLHAMDKKEARPGTQAFSMANFPTLEDAAVAARSGKEWEEAQAMDDMLEALRQLKISMDKGSATQHLLIECLDIRPILEQGKMVEQVVTSLCAEAGAEVIQAEVFERQDAVAITVATVEQAKHCMVQLQLQQVHRRKIQLCFLEEFPSHALLNKMVSDMRAAGGGGEGASGALPPAAPRDRFFPAAPSGRAPGRPPQPPRPVNYVSAFPELPTQHRPPPPAAPARAPLAPAAPPVVSGSPPLNPAAPAFAPSPSARSFSGAHMAGAATASCSSASSIVGTGEPGGTSTNAVAARSSTAATLLQQQRQQQQQQPRPSASPPPPRSRTAAQAVAPAGRAAPEDEEEAALQLALEVSKQDTHMRDVWEQESLEQEQADRAGPVQQTQGTLGAVHHACCAPEASRPSTIPALNVDKLVQVFNALHLSITNTQVLGKYRSLSHFQLPANLFKNPELINADERCALALFNIDTQALEGLWEATFSDMVAGRVFFQKVLDSPPLPLPRVKALLDTAGVPMIALDSERLTMEPKAKLVGRFASAVVRMMLLGPQQAITPPREAAAAPAAPPPPTRPPTTPSPPPTAIPPRPSPSLASAARGPSPVPQPSTTPAAPAAPPPARPPGVPSPPPAVAATASSAQPIGAAPALAAAGAPRAPSPPMLQPAAFAAAPAAPISAAAQQPAQAPLPSAPPPPRAPAVPGALPPALAMMMSRLPRPQQQQQQQPPPQQQPPISPTPTRPTPIPASPASRPPASAPSPPAFGAPSPTSSSSATSAAANQPLPASRPSPPPPTQPPPSKPTIQARLMCIMCGMRRATWFNMVCKHMGPCEACMPQGEETYKQCLKCGGDAKLRRVF